MTIKVLFVWIMLFFPILAHCQTDTTKHAGYEYMTVIAKQFDSRITNIYVSDSKGEYQELTFDILKKVKPFDNKPVLELLEKYSQKGWEVTGTNLTNTGTNFSNTYFYTYYFLRRRK